MKMFLSILIVPYKVASSSFLVIRDIEMNAEFHLLLHT